MRIRFSLALIIFIFSGCAVAQVTSGNRIPYTITIAASPTVANAGSHVKLTITTKNVSDQIVYHLVASGKPGRNLDIAVLDTQCNQVIETPYRRKLHGSEPHEHPWGGSVFVGRYAIKPGQSFEEIVDLSKEYDLTQPGTYSIQAFDQIS